MFAVKYKNFITEKVEIISKHRTKENAEKKLEKLEEKERILLSVNGFRTSNNRYYIEEI